VVNKKNAIEGIISIHDIKEHLYEKETLNHILIASDLAKKWIKTVTLDENCHTVLEIISENNLEGLPVVESYKTQKILGMIWRRDILDAYHKEVERRDITSSYASKITMKNIDNRVHFMKGYAMIEIPVPKNFVGKSIKDLNIRAEYGVDINLIKSNTEGTSKIKAMPSPDYIFSFNDSVVISGEIGKLNLLKNL